jgi:hypothetical protein
MLFYNNVTNKKLNRKGVKKVVDVDISETLACNVGQSRVPPHEKPSNIQISHIKYI